MSPALNPMTRYSNYNDQGNDGSRPGSSNGQVESLPKMRVAERRKITKIGGAKKPKNEENDVQNGEAKEEEEGDKGNGDTLEKVERVTGSDLANLGVSYVNLQDKMQLIDTLKSSVGFVKAEFISTEVNKAKQPFLPGPEQCGGRASCARNSRQIINDRIVQCLSLVGARRFEIERVRN